MAWWARQGKSVWAFLYVGKTAGGLRYSRFDDRPLGYGYGYGGGNGHVLSAQIIDVEINTRLDEVQHLLARLTDRYASRQVRYVRAPAGFPLFDDN